MATAGVIRSRLQRVTLTSVSEFLAPTGPAIATWPMRNSLRAASSSAVSLSGQLKAQQRCNSGMPCGAAAFPGAALKRAASSAATAGAASVAAAAAIAGALSLQPGPSTSHCDAGPTAFTASLAVQQHTDAAPRVSAGAAAGIQLQGRLTRQQQAVLRKPFPMTNEEAAGGLAGDAARFKRWLAAVGADVAGIDISASPAGAGAGLTLMRSHNAAADGWLSSTWHWLRRAAEEDVTVASFPQAAVLSAQTATQDPLLGRGFQRLLQQGTLDERAAIMLLLLIERKRGERSPLAPWLNLLPRSFSTPLHFSGVELDELRGTTLHAATRVKREQLPKVWAQLQPVAHDLLRKAGETGDATYADFVWAFSVFWSRAQSLAPQEDAGSSVGGGTVGGANGIAAGVTTPLEALVPGLDFCNHATGPACRWEPQGDRVALVAPRRWRPAPGVELAISYGDKSNEELLFHYGFVEEGNPHDVLMVACPLPPVEQWGEDMHARAALLAAGGHTPQLFLPVPQPADRELPAAAFDTLAALVMDTPQLAAALRAMEAGNRAEAELGLSQAPAAHQQQHQQQDRQQEAEDAGLRMAVLTSAARLLEAKLEDMEGSEGTGPLESDVELLAKAQMPSSLRACVIYRSSQKRIARGWLAVVNAQLQREMQALGQQPDGI